MYARCGALAKARQVLEELPVRNVVTWNALIAGYVQQGQEEEALKCFDSIQCDGCCPDVVTFICALKACMAIGAVAKGEQIYEKIASLGMLNNGALGSAVVDMYARCGALAKAQQVLSELPVRNVFSWTVLIAGYVQHGQGDEALKCFDNMQQDGHTPNMVTFSCVLKACGSLGASAKGMEIHDKIVSLGMLDKDIVLGSALVDMYARLGALTKAEEVLAQLPARNVVTWTALIAGYTQQERGKEALECFDNMQYDGHTPNAITFACALKACGNIGAATKGEQIHEKVLNLGMLEDNVVLGSALVDMYARCGSLTKAQKVLKELPIQDVVMWTALIEGFVQQGQVKEALKWFDNMQRDGHAPNAVTFTCALKACGNIGAASRGAEIYNKIVSLGMLEKDFVLGTTLVDMYTKCGALSKAQQVFDELPIRNAATWNTLIAGYAHQGQGEEALKCFDSMQQDGHSPDIITFTCALKACGSIGAATKGKQIHDKVVSLGMLEKEFLLGNALVDMYARCGTLAKAQQVFAELIVRDVASWTAVIVGYALQGKRVEAVDCLERMQFNGVKPDSTILLCVLNSCSHSGLSDEAEMYFSTMCTKYSLTPDLDHYCCMVDLFGRAGKFNKALEMIEGMQSVHLPVWVALLSACHKWGEVQIGRFAFEFALHLDKNNVAIYVCMANIYTAAGMEADADECALMRVTRH